MDQLSLNNIKRPFRICEKVFNVRDRYLVSFFAKKALSAKSVPTIRTMEMGSTMNALGIKPAII